MRKVFVCMLAAGLMGSIAKPATAQSLGEVARRTQEIETDRRADIEQLMDVTGASKLAAQMASTISDAFFNGFKQTNNGAVPPRMIEIVSEVLNSEFSKAFTGSEIREKQIALYAKYFTREDVRALLAFYQTEIGKKSIAVMPALSREGAEIGQDWAKSNMPRILQVLQSRLKTEGLIP